VWVIVAEIIVYLARMFEVRKIEGVPEGALAIIEQSEFGVPTGLRYRHLNTARQLPGQIHPRFLCVMRGDRIIAMIGLTRREVSLAGKVVPSWYIRYLAIPSSGRIKDTRKGKVSFVEEQKSSKIKERISELMAESFASTESDDRFMYAVVEGGNAYSQHVCRTFGFSRVRGLRTFVFSRLMPRNHPAVREAVDSDREYILARLNEYYSSYNLYFPAHVFHMGKYFVMEENGEIIAGVKSNDVAWKMINIPGRTGRFLLRYGKSIPIVKKIFNPERFAFIAFEAIWCKEGRERDLMVLLDAVLNRMGYNVGMIWADGDSDLSRLMEKHLRSGLIGLFNENENTADIIIRITGSPEELDSLHHRPVYMSSFDMV
jgi:hypothetical protein